ncbi:L-gulonolactone oxidase-like isoform X2 [Parus major]|uniref:L-gulonolactone oxidase-like isoform X2 n=1 Tax=Parus major TaxID=9157 RepID=UPI0007710163|nr:L-gulonolactone oxidase-like isoform X2 [Parus major]
MIPIPGDLSRQVQGESGFRFWNWSHTYGCSPELLFRPRNLHELRQVDKEKLQVKVEAGILLSELNLELDKHGMALANLGAVAEVTAAGVIGTGTHNTGIGHGILPTQVVALSLLLASGEILECSESLNAEVFQAARLHLGCLGIVLSVTFQCVPEFRLREVAFPSTLPQVGREFPREFWEFFSEFFLGF